MTGVPRVEPLGDSALLVVLGEGTDPQLLARVAGLVERIGRADLAGAHDIVPAYGSVAVFFDPLAQDGDALAAQLARVAQGAETHAPPSPRTTHVLPVRYDGPDLADVAERTGLSPAEVIRRHAGADYGVHFLGFAPGFAYLGPLDPSLVLPRRAQPRRRVPPGSVAIAGAQTGVYPLETPGGWHLIGRTEVALFDPARDPPNLLAAGDRVRFSPVE